MKQRRISLILICAALLTAILCILPTGVLAANEVQSKITVNPRPPYIFCVDEVTGGRGFSASSMIYAYESFSMDENQPITFKGWFATDEGISSYEYAFVSDMYRTPVWTKASDIQIVPRPDLKNAGISYVSGHETAGFTFTVYPDATMTDGYYDLYVRAVSGDGTGLDMVVFSHMRYGDPDPDDGEIREISFPRLAKTQGALINASVTEEGLVMTNNSSVSLGNMELGAFMKINISYSLSQTYHADKQPLIGFKSSPEHLYGNGEGQYDLTDHIIAIPIDTSKTEEQTVSVNLEDVSLPSHKALYLSTYLCDGVSITIHEIEMVYRGMGYDRTAAKIYFSEDVLSYFEGVNQVNLQGVTDPVMGDVLRIEVKDDTNDPYTHFNAWKLLNHNDLRLSADDYKYMVVLARANAENLHSNMTFYLCAGTIYGATEACTYTHTLIKDGKWHYYVFDLTDKENWKGCINGWRFDIINGDSIAGNYVDFASVQFFSTAEAANQAASKSVTQNVTPHALGMSTVVRDDSEQPVLKDNPVVFEDGDWFVETEPETEPPTEPETQPEEPTQTTPSDTVPTLPSDPSETSAPIPDTEATTESVSLLETDTLPETEAEASSASGCSSTVSALCLLFLFPFTLIIKRRIYK